MSCADCVDTLEEQPGPRSDEQTKWANSRDQGAQKSHDRDPNQAGRGPGETEVGGTDLGTDTPLPSWKQERGQC